MKDVWCDLPLLPADEDGPVFAEPWQAQAFAMTVSLHKAGLFSWGEWAQALSSEVKRPDAAADGNDYYERWLAALEKLLVAKGAALPADVEALAAARQADPAGERSAYRHAGEGAPPMSFRPAFMPSPLNRSSKEFYP